LSVFALIRIQKNTLNREAVYLLIMWCYSITGPTAIYGGQQMDSHWFCSHERSGKDYFIYTI